MSMIYGADSAVPQPTSYAPVREIWGVYAAGETPHVWSRDEVAEIGRHGGKAVLPIVVPNQDIRWWMIDETGGYDYLESLVRKALAWGSVAGTPLALDIEEPQAEVMGASATTVVKAWAAACQVHGLTPWIYGGLTVHRYTDGGPCLRWLADWDGRDALPTGFHGHQYEGGADGGRIDLDVFEGGRTYLGVDFQPVTLGTAPTEVAPTPAEQQARAEATAVEDAIASEDAAAKISIVPSPSIAERLRTHAAELVDLAAELEGKK